MKKIELGQLLTIIANFGVIVGILLLVYELNQAREFARIEFLANNNTVFQQTEREMMNPEIAAIWAKAAVDPVSLTTAEIRAMDAFLIGLYNFWRQKWELEQEGFLPPGQSEIDLSVDIPFYFGSTFAQVWWEDLKSIHVGPDVLEFDALIDKVLADTDPYANRDYLERLQRLVRESASTDIDDLALAGEELMQLSRDWSDLVASGNLEAGMEFWAEDAVMLPPDMPILEGREAIREYVEASAELPGFRISWEPITAKVSEAGDMAYMIERNLTELLDEAGNRVEIPGKVVTVWRKDSDGAWRNVVDMWNAVPGLE